MTVRSRLAVAAAAALVVAGCGLVTSSVPVEEAVVAPDGGSIEVVVDACGGDVSVRVRESEESVTLHAGVRGGSGTGCRTAVTVEAESPLDGRRLIDGYDFTLLEAAP